MEILKYNSSNGAAHILETCDTTIIQGQVYDKLSMEVEPFSVVSVVGNGQHTLSINRWCMMDSDTTATNEYRHETRSRSDMVVRDNKDSTVSYVFAQRRESSLYLGEIAKIKTENERTSKVWGVTHSYATTTGYSAEQRGTVVEVIGQTDNSIICVVAFGFKDYSTHSKNNVNQLISINKTNGAMKMLTDNDYTVRDQTFLGNVIQKIYEDDFNLYAIFFLPKSGRTASGVTPGVSNIYVISKSTDTVKKIVISDSGETNSIYSYFSKGIFKDNKIMFYQYLEPLNPKVRLITFDLASHEVSTKNVLVTFNEKLKTLPTASSLTDISDSSVSIDLIIKEFDGLKYLLFVPCMTKRNGIIHNDLYKIKTFLIDENNNLDLIAQGEVSPYNGSTIRGVVEMLNEKYIMLSNKAGINIFRFNTKKANFEKVQDILIPCNAYGCDQNNKIWVKDLGGNVTNVDLNYAINVNIGFVNENYSYKGENIETSIKIEVINYESEYIAKDLNLSISGPAYFGDDKKNLSVKTEAGKPLVVPIIIKDSGIITIYPKIVM